MSITQAIVLGIVQGLTEFLPISSSGHLIFIPEFFGWPDQGLMFDVMLHMGTLVAVIVYFYKKLWAIIRGFFLSLVKKGTEVDRLNGRLGWLLIVSIIPAGIVGLLFGDAIETQLRSPVVIIVTLVFWGSILYIADRWGRKHRDLDNTNWKDALIIGCAQALALIPGTSRSGITMTTGLFRGMTKKSAAEFSFLMSVPVIFLAGVLTLSEAMAGGTVGMSVGVLSVGFITAMLSGLLAISLLMKVIQKWSFTPFVVYRILIAVVIYFALM